MFPALAAKRFYVIRFDNRDVGLSSKIESGPEPELAEAFAGDSSSAGYTLWDMAEDAVGLLDALGIAKAHIVGASMGGMIVQAMAIKHADRVLSMTSIMSTTGNPAVGQATPEAMGALMAPPAELPRRSHRSRRPVLEDHRRHVPDGRGEGPRPPGRGL